MQSNFEFLDQLDGELAHLGRLAESYFHDDPSTSLIKLRQFSERLAQRHAILMGVDLVDADTQVDLLRKLKYDRAAPERVLDVLHYIRKLGNAAVHEGQGDHRQALACLKMSVQLGVWHLRASTKDGDFSPGPFVPPRTPETTTEELSKELDRLRRERDDALTAAQKAEEQRKQALLDAESAEARHQRELSERQTWEALAQDADKELQELAARVQAQTALQKMEFVRYCNLMSGNLF